MFDAAASREAAAECDFISITEMMKATPVEEGGRRYLFIEASNEAVDYQGEVVLAKALADSAEYFLKFGNLDLDHVTQTGPRRGPPNYPLYEIGRPVDVKVSGRKVFTKGELFMGDSPAAGNANTVWDSLTKLRPAQRWFPSVGGSVLAKAQEVGPDGRKRTVVSAVRWANIGLSKTPVNLNVPTVSTVPFGALAKSWGAHGFDLTKALEMAGAGSDVAELTGGAALQKQSLDRGTHSYFDFREKTAGAIRNGGLHPISRAIVNHARAELGVPADEAAEWTERMLGDLRRARKATPNTTQKESRHAG